MLLAVGGLCLTPIASPSSALFAGVVLALLGFNPFPRRTGKLAKTLIQVCIVVLGLSMNLHDVAKAGQTGMIFAVGTIAGTFTLGLILGRVFKLGAKLTTLLSSGTAICGGSAIAATGTVIAASEAEMAVATGCVFMLNGIALYLMPAIGHAMHPPLSQAQFGTWAAVAIHDVSSVVGAAQCYDRFPEFHGSDHAMKLATAIKLARTLWIIPVALTAGWAFSKFKLDSDDAKHEDVKKKPMPIPWFIGLFVLAAAVSTWFPRIHDLFPAFLSPDTLAKVGMTLALYLIGAGMSVRALKAVGWRALVVGVSLWAFISVVSFFVVRATVV